MSTSFAIPPSPALLTSTSRPPVASIAAPNIASTCAWSVTSHTTVAGVVPATSVRRSAASPRRRSWWSLITTVAPSSAQRFATANPMPVPAAAVTRTVFPASRSCAGG